MHMLRVVPLEELLPLAVPGLLLGAGPEHALLLPCKVTGEIIEMMMHHPGLLAARCRSLTAAAVIAEGYQLTDARCCAVAAGFLVKLKELVLLKLFSTDTAAQTVTVMLVLRRI